MALNPPPFEDDTQPVLIIRDNRPHRALVLLGLALVVGVAALTCGVVAFNWLAEQSKAHPVTVTADGSTRIAMTYARTVSALLSDMSIALLEGDMVTPALNTPITDDLHIEVVRSRSVTLTVDGQSRIYRTHLTNPTDIMHSAGLSLAGKDRVFVDGTEATQASLTDWPVPASQITIRRALTVTIDDAGRQLSVETTSDTVGEALFDAGITLYAADTVTPESHTPLSADMTIMIERSRPVTIIADGVTLETRVAGVTVGDALASAGLALVGLDYSVPDTDVRVRGGMRIRVIRAREEVIVEETVQPYETVYQADAGLELDQIQLAQAGQNGVIQTSIRVRYENGIEISRTVEDTRVAQEAMNEVIAYGTNVVLRSIDTPEGPRQYWRRIRMYATSYHPAALGGDNITATGDTLRKGIVGSNPDVLPYGTEVYVPGYGIGKMADTGALTRRLRIDLGYSDEDWVSWSRWVDVYLLAPVPAQIDYILPSE